MTGSPGRRLVGRAPEIARFTELLQPHRLLTVVGTGGVGKTSLVAEATTGTPAAWCRLAEVEDAAAVRHTVAAALGLSGATEDLGQAVAARVGDGTTVVVLDNCEHVLDAAAQVAAELVDAPVRLVATSRQPLELSAEVLLRVPPLPLPEPGEPDSDASPAVALFTDRARRAREDFTLDERTRPAVVEVVRALGGVPLALELAAARVRSTGVGELAALLSDPSRLRTTARDVERRHRSLEAVIDWSYRLLTDEERAVLDRLSVHPAGVDLPAAQDVVRRLGLDEAATTDLLDSLVTQSLLVLEDRPPAARYRLLEPVRLFALHRLTEAGEERTARDEHAAYYTALADRVHREGHRRWSTELAPILAEVDNLRAAITWALAEDRTCDRVLTMLAPMFYVGVQQRGAEILDLCRRALARWPDERTHPRFSEVHAAASVSALSSDDLEAAREHARAAIDAASSPSGVAWGWRTLAQADHHDGRSAEALAALDRADLAAEAAGFEPLRCDLLGLRVDMLVQVGQPEAALVCARSALELAEAQDNVYEHAWALHLIGLLLVESDPDAARDLLEAALEESRVLPYPYGIHASARGLGSVETQAGRHREAAAWLLEGLELFGQAGMSLERGNSLAAAVPLLVATGDREAAAVVVGHLAAQGQVVELIAAPGYEPLRQELCEDASLAPALQRGGAIGWLQVVAGVRRRLAALAGGQAAGESERPGSLRDGPPAGRPELVRAGSLWRLCFEGTEAHVPASKGMGDLAMLLERPGREVAALDLVGGPETPREGDLGEVADASARAAYAARLHDLRAELDDADRWGDAERAARAQEEYDELSRHLTAAYGLHGARRAGDPAERARAAVTGRLRAAIKRIATVHPELGRHLAHSVHTGRFCCYAPEEDVRWHVVR